MVLFKGLLAEQQNYWRGDADDERGGLQLPTFLTSPVITGAEPIDSPSRNACPKIEWDTRVTWSYSRVASGS